MATGNAGTSRGMWSEEAVLVRMKDDGTDRVLVAEGSLLSIMRRVAGMDMNHWSKLLVSMPDRSSPPFRFEPKQFAGLIVESEARRTA